MKFTSKQQIRIEVLTKYSQGHIFIEDALNVLEIKERQFRRVLKRFREEGVSSVLHGNQLRKPVNITPQPLITKILKLYKLKYFDHNISHFRERLIEDEQLENIPSYTTLRKFLLREGLVSYTKKKIKKSHSLRKRYAKEGLMVQIDGSHHRWFYGQGMCCLTAAIDDATGKILSGRFTQTETTFAAMNVVEDIIKSKGKFQMLYSDRAGIYGGGNSKRGGYSNMTRAMKELGIVPIQASTAQAKGRVERLFKTLQSRLCADFRIKNITTLEEATRYFNEEYIPKHNKKFAVKSESNELGYQELNDEIDLEQVFCMKDTRIVQNGNVISINSETLIIESLENYSKRTVEIRNYRNGKRGFFIGETEVQVVRYDDLKAVA